MFGTWLSFGNLKKIFSENYILITLSGITLLALFLRFYHLDYNSLWEDEITTTIIINQGLIEIFNRIFVDVRPTPPLFYILEHFVFVFGDGDWLLRLIPALFGSATIPIVYLVGKDIVNKCGGLIASALLAVSVFHIYYSQEARAYSTLLFLFLVAVFFYIQAIKTNKLKYWVLFSLFSALSFWCHFYIVIGIGLLYLHAVLINIRYIKLNKLIIRNYMVSVLLLVLLVSPLIISLLSILSVQLNPIQPGLTGIYTAPYAIYKMLTWEWTTITLVNCIIVGIYCLLALAGWLFIFRKSHRSALLLAMFVAIPPVLSVVLSLLFGLAVWQQYLAFVLPFLLIAISGLILFGVNKISLKKITIVMICVILILSILYLPTYYTTYTKSDWRGAYSDLSNLTNPCDTVVLFSDVGEYTNPYYYYDFVEDGTNVITTVSSLDDLKRKMEGVTSGDVYFIFTWNLEDKDISAIAPTGSEFLDDLIEDYYVNTLLGVGDEEMVGWLANNTELCAVHTYFGPYRDIQIRRLA